MALAMVSNAVAKSLMVVGLAAPSIVITGAQVAEPLCHFRELRYAPFLVMFTEHSKMAVAAEETGEL